MFRKLVLGVIAVVLLALAGGAVYQWYAQRADARRFPPPGRLVEVDGLSMHVDCRGSGRPVMILEAGLTTGSWSWGSVFDAVAEHTEVCAYDRPGMGWSEPINRTAAAGEVADRLHGVIEAAGIEGPYVLLGMSAGGVYVREYYARYPQNVVGMVLVDSSHEQQGDRMPPFEGTDMQRMLRVCSALQPLGVVRAMGTMGQMLDRIDVPADARPLLESRLNQSHYCASMLAESQSFEQEIHDPTAPASLGDLPLIVLSQGKEPEADEAFGVSEEYARAQRAAWNELQQELAALSSRGQRRVAEDSGHVIQLDQPQIVIDAVTEMVDGLRGSVPSREGFVDVEGGRVWYRVVGSGPATPLLLLHGGPGAPSYYLEPLAALADERPVVFYDQLGAGRSDRPSDVSLWRIDRFVDELATVRAVLGLDQVHLLGHSWGAMLAFDYLRTAPGGVRSVVLASPMFSARRFVADAERLKAELPADLQAVIERDERAGTTDSDEYQAAVMAYYHRHLSRSEPWSPLLEQGFAGFGQEVYQYMWGPSEFTITGTLGDYEREDALHQLDLPVLFTAGRYDETTPESVAHYQSLVPGSKLTVFEHSAHMTMLDEPEAYVAAVRAFLDEVDARAGP